jgi:hypothetical protein
MLNFYHWTWKAFFPSSDVNQRTREVLCSILSYAEVTNVFFLSLMTKHTASGGSESSRNWILEQPTVDFEISCLWWAGLEVSIFRMKLKKDSKQTCIGWLFWIRAWKIWWAGGAWKNGLSHVCRYASAILRDMIWQ